MTHNRLSGMVMVATNHSGAVWLTTPAELQRKWQAEGLGDFPDREVSLYEITGSAVNGPIKLARGSLPGTGGPEVLLGTYPDGRYAFRIERS
jgi:hypothetical protein